MYEPAGRARAWMAADLDLGRGRGVGIGGGVGGDGYWLLFVVVVVVVVMYIEGADLVCGIFIKACSSSRLYHGSSSNVHGR